MPPLWKQILNTNPLSSAGEAVAPLWQKILQPRQPQSMQPTAQPLWKRILGEPFQGAESIVPLAQKTRALTRQYIDQPFERLTQPIEQSYMRKFNVSPEQMAQIKPKAELANNMIMGLTEPLKFSNLASKLSKTDNLNPLLQEAQKAVAEGKTVEEFIKKRGYTPVFRGGGKLGIDISKITDMGISVSTDRKISQSFMGGESGLVGKSRVDELYIKPDAKVLTIKDLKNGDELRQIIQQWNVADAAGHSNVPYEKAIVKLAKDNGFDTVDLTHLGEKEIRIVNPDVLKTKSQLTNLWNRANK